MFIVDCILMKPSRIFDYHNETRCFITKTFDRFNYKDLVSIFQLNLKLLVIFTKCSPRTVRGTATRWMLFT